MSERNDASEMLPPNMLPLDDDRLTQALERRPFVPLPAGFAARVAAAAVNQAPAQPCRLPRRPSLGIATGLVAMLLLLLAMIRLAFDGTGATPMIAELTLCTEFLLLLGGLLYMKSLQV